MSRDKVNYPVLIYPCRSIATNIKKTIYLIGLLIPFWPIKNRRSRVKENLQEPTKEELEFHRKCEELIQDFENGTKLDYISIIHNYKHTHVK